MKMLLSEIFFFKSEICFCIRYSKKTKGTNNSIWPLLRRRDRGGGGVGDFCMLFPKNNPKFVL